MLLQNCVLEADNHFFIQTLFRLFMFYKCNNQIITSKRNPKHPLSLLGFATVLCLSRYL
ncbi:hypothetical protein Hdeb2414_s0229g00840961 [Helianthus debilis subsp. tardiflorus]